ncbi:MFS transporter [Cohnella sp.]|uniref:MFS transporter n=1 Tax=Cohnella sp. TaxID=1883426 RepID=UPI0037037A9E
MESKKKRDLASIATIPLGMTLANSMLIPVIPMMQKVLGINSLQASLIITSYAVIAIFFIPVTGYLSDRIGRKKVILPGLLLVAAAGGLAGWAATFCDHPYRLILWSRLLQGLGAAACFPVVLPLVGDLFRNEDDVSNGLGIVETANTFGKVLSPVLGSALALWAWYIPFWAIPAISLISFILVAAWVKVPKESKQAMPFKPFVDSIKSIYRQKGRWIWAIYAAGGISMFVLFGTLFFLSETLEQKGIDGIGKGGLLAIPLAGLCTASWLVGKWIGQKKQLMKWIGVAGFLVAAACLLGLGLLKKDSTIIIIGFLFAASIGLGAALPCIDALLTEGIDKEQRGTVMSFYSSIRFLGVAAGPPFTAWIISRSPSVFYLTLCASCFAASLVAWFLIKPEQRSR